MTTTPTTTDLLGRELERVAPQPDQQSLRAALRRCPIPVPPEVGRDVLYRFSSCLELIRRRWIAGDREHLSLISAGFEPQTHGFEAIARGQIRNGVGYLIRKCLEDAVYLPQVLPPHYAGVCEQASRFLRAVAPDSERPDKYGDTSERWRQTWPAMNLNDDLGELVLKLRAAGDGMQTEPNHIERKTDAQEERDADGYVISPLDRAAYIPMQEALNLIPITVGMTRRKLGTLLDNNRDSIRQYKPGKKRRMVHCGDFAGHIRTRAATDGDWASPEEVERRKAVMRAQKKARGA